MDMKCVVCKTPLKECKLRFTCPHFICNQCLGREILLKKFSFLESTKNVIIPCPCLSGKLENAAEQIKNYNWDYLSQLETFCAVLLFITGKKYVSKEIHGSCQGDWQVIVYPADEYTDEEIKMYEALYFNTGTEWSIEESTPDYDGNIKAYCFGNTPDEIRKEIADYTGNAPEEIVLHEFVGYAKIPQYRII